MRWCGGAFLRGIVFGSIWREKAAPLDAPAMKPIASCRKLAEARINAVGDSGRTARRRVVMPVLSRPGCGQLPASHLARALTAVRRRDTPRAIHIDERLSGQVAAEHLAVGRASGTVHARHVTLDNLDNLADVTGRFFYNTATIAKGAHADGRMSWRPVAYFRRLEHLREAQ
jgi:hypothetical protein